MKRTIASFSAIAVLGLTTSLLAQTAPAGQPAPTPTPAKPGLSLTTTGFEDGGIIPNKYTGAAAPAAPVSPPLTWANVPDGTTSFVLTMHDPDTALGHRTDEVLHWLDFNIPGTSRGLPEGVPAMAQLPDGSMQLSDARSKTAGYRGPGAPAAGPYHHYMLELFALDTKLDLGPTATEADIDSAMQGHILAKAVLVGRFHRP